MADLIERKPLYELAVRLEAEALDEASKLIERGRVGEVTSEDWRIWSAVLTERTAFKYDVLNAPSAELETVRCKDCKHNSLKRMSGNTCCDLGMGLFQLYDFCSLGERKEDG